MADREYQKTVHAPLGHNFFAGWTIGGVRPSTYPGKRFVTWDNKDVTLTLAAFGEEGVESIRRSFTNLDDARAFRDQLTKMIDWVDEPFPEASRE